MPAASFHMSPAGRWPCRRRPCAGRQRLRLRRHGNRNTLDGKTVGTLDADDDSSGWIERPFCSAELAVPGEVVEVLAELGVVVDAAGTQRPIRLWLDRRSLRTRRGGGGGRRSCRRSRRSSRRGGDGATTGGHRRHGVDGFVRTAATRSRGAPAPFRRSAGFTTDPTSAIRRHWGRRSRRRIRGRLRRRDRG